MRLRGKEGGGDDCPIETFQKFRIEGCPKVVGGNPYCVVTLFFSLGVETGGQGGLQILRE